MWAFYFPFLYNYNYVITTYSTVPYKDTALHRPAHAFCSCILKVPCNWQNASGNVVLTVLWVSCLLQPHSEESSDLGYVIKASPPYMASLVGCLLYVLHRSGSCWWYIVYLSIATRKHIFYGFYLIGSWKNIELPWMRSLTMVWYCDCPMP